MALRVYKVGDFTHTHERRGFRMAIEALKRRPSTKPIYIIANPKLPTVAYRPPTGKIREYTDVNPDFLILKDDVVAVVEMKSCPGVIHFPVEKEKMWDPWFFEHDGKRVIVNEGAPSPLSQVHDNYKAVTAFLEQYENEFADSPTKGSKWHKTQKIILFTEPGSTFANPAPAFWRSTHIANLDTSNPEFDFAGLVHDLTTPAREHRTDERSQITLTESSIEKIISLLGAHPSEEEIPDSRVEEAIVMESPGYGYATMIANSSGETGRSSQGDEGGCQGARWY